MRDECQIQNPDGSHNSRACRNHCERLVRQKILSRLPRTKGSQPKFRIIKYPDPSSSGTSPTVLTLADMDAAVGVTKASVRKIERLIGFGIIPANTRLVPHYL